MRLISDVGRLSDELGWDVMRRLLAPGIYTDGPKMVTPVVLQDDGSRTLLCRQQETGNLAALGVGREDFEPFDPYFTFDATVAGTAITRNLTTAVAELCGDHTLTVEGDLPYARYRPLAEALDLHVDQPATPNIAVRVHRVNIRSVLARFARIRSQGAAVAARLVERRPGLAALGPLLNPGSDCRFSLLSESLAENGCDAVLLTTPLNQGEVMAQAQPEGPWVLWHRDADEVLVIAAEGRCDVPGVPGPAYRSPRDAVAQLVGGGVLGLEDKSMGVSEVLGLCERVGDVVPLSYQLSRWRERREHEDLSFVVMVAQASRHCMELALSEARRWIERAEPVSEQRVYARYCVALKEFQQSHRIPFPIEPFFVNCHTGERTGYPSMPTEEPVTSATRCVKFDAGVRVVVDGLTMAASDIGRTLALTPDGHATYQEFRTIVREEVIGSLRVGDVCEDVHARCVDAILRRESMLVGNGTMPSGVDFASAYGTRNVGHLMGKQESFVTEFRPGDRHVLHEGAVGAVEIQWPYDGYTFASEDLWVLTSEGAVITSG